MRITAPDSITNVDWFDAVKYCRWLSEREGIAEDQMCYPPLDKIGLDLVLPENLLERTGYRLPPAAEWEYACRAGATTSRHFGESPVLMEQYAWYKSVSENRSQPVGLLKPNDFGLFDIHGNALEWCQNWYFDEYPTPTQGDTLVDGADKRSGFYRAMRGGSYLRKPEVIRAADRDNDVPSRKSYELGFRIARSYRSDHGK